ncbi:uncharacterized protein LOC119897785 [Micropterus salmoides]|uniref:uncharacterized protein LOC119897785 n=1 Tax=Micropterus salmoides TaxID=27706 RepID=UPI0018EA52A6|nr:uncharacterized protein LOC119897785 [Micropterus salmoides]
MKLFVSIILLPFASMVVTTPVRAQRQNVLSLLNDALAPTTEKTIPAIITDALKDSHEIVIPNAVEKDKAPSRRNTGVDQDNMRPMDMSSRLVWDQGSREHSGPHRPHQASRERTDLNSEEGMMVYAQEAENLPGKQVIHLNEDQVTDSDSLETIVQRKATPGRANGLNGMLAPGPSKKLLDWDSLEENRPAPVGNRGDTDYDETREFISSETSPIAPPEHMPRSLSVPAKS